MKANKKGDLLNNVLSLLIAAIGIGLLVFAVVKLYGVTVNQEEENAKNTLNVIGGKIKNLNDGETGKYPIQGIEGMFLTGWSGDNKERPDKCFLKSCICVCKGDVENYYFNSLEISKKCQEKGFCRDIDKGQLSISSIIKAYEVGIEELKREEKLVNYITFPKNLIEIEIKKEKDLLSISIPV